jgi:hypothetical protein
MENSDDEWEYQRFYIRGAEDDSSNAKSDELWAQVDELLGEGWEKVHEGSATAVGGPEGTLKLDIHKMPPPTVTHGTFVVLRRRKP